MVEEQKGLCELDLSLSFPRTFAFVFVVDLMLRNVAAERNELMHFQSHQAIYHHGKKYLLHCTSLWLQAF